MRKGAIAMETLVIIGIALLVLVIVILMFVTGMAKGAGTMTQVQENATQPIISKIPDEINKITGDVTGSIISLPIKW